MAEKISLREFKKNRTRTDLVEVSRQLFRKQGYDATTLEQIASEAKVSVPTLLAYFPSKERLAFAGEWDAYEELRQRILDPARTESTLDLWRSFVIDRSTRAEASRQTTARNVRVEETSAALTRARLTLLQALEDVVAEGLSVDYGTDPHTYLPTRLTATMLAFGWRSVTRQWGANNGRGDLTAMAVAVVDIAASTLDVMRHATEQAGYPSA